jgi:hypothetical protein
VVERVGKHVDVAEGDGAGGDANVLCERPVELVADRFGVRAEVLPAAQALRAVPAGDRRADARWPGRKVASPSTTSPENSWPMIAGKRTPAVFFPRKMRMSVPQMVAALTRSTRSPLPGLGSGASPRDIAFPRRSGARCVNM